LKCCSILKSLINCHHISICVAHHLIRNCEFSLPNIHLNVMLGCLGMRIPLKFCWCDASMCSRQNLLIEIYFHFPTLEDTLEDTHTILSNITIAPLIFTILVFR
jgi:hypothetical protein